MRKILAILLVGIFVVAIPSASSTLIPRIGRRLITNTPITTADVPEWADGNITGVYAMKNETGYEILGTLFAYYGIVWGSIGKFAGMWESLDGNSSGQFAGWFFYHVAIGYYNITGSEDDGGFIGLLRFNETDMTIKAVSWVTYGEEDYFTRYALCSYTKFE
jgi:hypothetical protein